MGHCWTPHPVPGKEPDSTDRFLDRTELNVRDIAVRIIGEGLSAWIGDLEDEGLARGDLVRSEAHDGVADVSETCRPIYLETGLLENLAARGLMQVLTSLDNASWQEPRIAGALMVPLSDQEHLIPTSNDCADRRRHANELSTSYAAAEDPGSGHLWHPRRADRTSVLGQVSRAAP